MSSREVLPLLGAAPGDDGVRAEVDAAARRRAVQEARAAWEKEHGPPAPGKPGPFPFLSVVEARRHRAEVPREVEVTYEDGTRETLPWPTGQRWGRWELTRPVRVKEAVLGPGSGYALDLDRLDDGRTREPSRSGTARLALGAEGWIRVLLALVEAL